MDGRAGTVTVLRHMGLELRMWSIEESAPDSLRQQQIRSGPSQPSASSDRPRPTRPPLPKDRGSRSSYILGTLTARVNHCRDIPTICRCAAWLARASTCRACDFRTFGTIHVLESAIT